VSRAASAGSRARSREIGYAEAMADMSHLLTAAASRWKNSAGKQVIPVAEAALTVAANEMLKLADYAHGVSQVYGTDHAMPIEEFLLEVIWDPRWCDPAPAELPQREHPDDN
jgi:hypothetical protein